MNNWISVKDRLPEIAGAYLVYCAISNVELAHWHVEKFWFIDVNNSIGRAHGLDVTHWQPLPDKPEEE